MDRRTAISRRTVLGVLAGASAASLAGCTALGGSGCANETHDVGMTDSAFDPPELTVSVGDTVTWLNTSGRAHTVTAYDNAIPEAADFFASGDFDSTEAARDAWGNGGGSIFSCESYEHTFEVPGTFNYFCIPHERVGMTGRIIVEE